MLYSIIMSNILGGLVGITAGADLMSPTQAILIGLIAGVVVILAVRLIDRLHLDDPVGAIPVHLFCGIWGTLAVGVFGEMASWNQLWIQFSSLLIIGSFCMVSSVIITLVLKYSVGLRVSNKAEIEGLDKHEHGMQAYADFGIQNN